MTRKTVRSASHASARHSSAQVSGLRSSITPLWPMHQRQNGQTLSVFFSNRIMHIRIYTDTHTHTHRHLFPAFPLLYHKICTHSIPSNLIAVSYTTFDTIVFVASYHFRRSSLYSMRVGYGSQYKNQAGWIIWCVSVVNAFS